MTFQQTIAADLVICGQGLHSGARVEMRLAPLPPGSGVQFGRSDLSGRPRVKAGIGAVVDTKKSTTLGRDDWRIATIEHLMAVFHGLGIDNILVEVDGAEIPHADGSGLFFARKIMEAGITVQNAPRVYTRIQHPVWVEGTVMKQGEPVKAMIVALPNPAGDERFEVSFTFTSDHRVTGTQYLHYGLSRESFMREVAPARTIAFRREIDYLQSQGLALGGDLDTVIVVGEESYENELRFPDEIVRHKILDILGDLYLLGPIAGQLVAVRSGHALDLELAKKIQAMSEMAYTTR